MQRIDAHIHYVGDHPDCLELLASFDLKLLNVCVAGAFEITWREQAALFRGLAERYPDRYAWCTTFDLPTFDDPHYADAVIAGLERDFAAGAVACKIWKNVGMAVRKPSGEFLMVDDPIFDPIYEYLASVGKPLLMHIAEPLACWQPPDETSPHYEYYRAHPEWHMYRKPEYPSHRELIEARDRVLAKHPRLRAIGAHLASLEYDVNEVARRLERYPNFAVDVSARFYDLMRQDSEEVRRFFIEYQDRILFGVDVVQLEPVSAMTEEARTAHIQMMRQLYTTIFAYFESGAEMHVWKYDTRGLALPDEVLEKFYRTNALQWYPELT